jgi:hypothetical protein
MHGQPKLCMFCAKDEFAGPMNTEHFVPRALWDQERPPLTKTLPAHESCNKKYMADNEYFRDILVFEDCDDPHPEIPKLRAGKISRKIQRRPGSISKTLDRVKLRPVVTRSGIFLGKKPSFVVNTKRMERVLKNVFKGCYYVANKKPLSPTTDVLIASDKLLLAPPIQKLIACLPKAWNHFGDDVFGCRYRGGEDDDGEFFACLMNFYRRKFYLGITITALFKERNPDLLDQIDELAKNG